MSITNVLSLPQPFVDAATSDHTYTPKRYSVTQLLKGTKEAILERRHAGETDGDVADMIWLIFGSAVHSILQNAQESDTQLKENWISADMPNGYTVSGIFDLYDDATGTVTDYKTASVWKVIYDEWDDYRKQTLLYCWILRQMGFDAKRGQIVALLKDHSKSKARFDQEYPQHPVVTKTWEFSDYEFDGAGEWLRRKFAEIEECEQLPDDEIPACTPDERWYKPGKYAVMKKGRKKAIKLYDDKAQADIHALEIGGYVEQRPSSDGKCQGYCSVCNFCSYWREHYGEDGK